MEDHYAHYFRTRGQNRNPISNVRSKIISSKLHTCLLQRTKTWWRERNPRSLKRGTRKLPVPTKDLCSSVSKGLLFSVSVLSAMQPNRLSLHPILEAIFHFPQDPSALLFIVETPSIGFWRILKWTHCQIGMKRWLSRSFVPKTRYVEANSKGAP